MKNFEIVTNVLKDKQLELTNYVISYIEKNGGICTMFPSDSKDTECIIVLGGDGTMLKAARDNTKKHSMLIGINLGTLGFLAEVDRENITDALDRLLRDEFQTQDRMMLQGILKDGNTIKKEIHALNDITITRRGILQIIHLKLYVNGQYLCTWKADGIVISTPTGSTGYNMSAGGPIIEPSANLIVLTPICAHTLSARSIVLKDDDIIELEVLPREEATKVSIEVSGDGCERMEIEKGNRIVVKKSHKTTTFVKLSDISFIQVLHKKMNG
ncbi:MAG: NAD(+)/NADH kinase [Lachnospiraceae bacterium]